MSKPFLQKSNSNNRIILYTCVISIDFNKKKLNKF